MMRRRSRHELTLLELILTMAIVMLLALLVVPRLMNASPRIAAESEGIRVRADLAYAQQLAIAHARTHRVVFDTINERVVVQRWDDYQFVTVTQRDLGSGVELATSTFTNGSVQFNLLGEPSEGGAVTLHGPDGTSVTVTVAPGTGLAIVE
jgi:Tfp pilus assembly protein FimT